MLRCTILQPRLGRPNQTPRPRGPLVIRSQTESRVMSGHYSLWLKPPDGPTCSKLAQEIAAQAKEYSGPLFEPHVTLLGGIDGEEDAVLEKARSLAGKLKVGDAHA